MKNVLFAVWLVLFALPACKSKPSVAQQQAEFFARQEALGLAPQRPATIFISGEVRHPVVEWTEGLTLSAALVQADYRGLRDPRAIMVTRQGRKHPVNPKALLRGEDVLLEAGDLVELER